LESCDLERLNVESSWLKRRYQHDNGQQAKANLLDIQVWILPENSAAAGGAVRHGAGAGKRFAVAFYFRGLD